MRAKLPSTLACLLYLLATTALAQTTIHVGSGQPYPTIQSGIDAAAPGDTVLIAPGTYYENINFNGKAITVTSSDGPTVTILDGGQTAPAVLFTTEETRDSILSGLAIQHGGSPSPSILSRGGIYLQDSSPTIRNNLFTQNNCWTIYATHSAPLIQSNTISATLDTQQYCGFGSGAGVFIAGNRSFSTETNDGMSTLIVGNTIENNVKSGLEDAGGNGGAGLRSGAEAPSS